MAFAAILVSFVVVAGCVDTNTTDPVTTRQEALTQAPTASNLRIFYAGNFFLPDAGIAYGSSTLNQLDDLRKAGANTLLVGIPWSGLSLSTDGGCPLCDRIRQDPILSKFKYMISLSDHDYGYWRDCVNGSLDPACSCYKANMPDAGCPIVPSAATLYSNLAQVEIANPDIFGGYYTLDEPSHPYIVDGGVVVPALPRAYEEAIYRSIRALDPDSANRPVALADVPLDVCIAADGGCDGIISQSDSLYAQDILMADHYTRDQTQQRKEFQVWRDLGFGINATRQVPFVFVLPSFDGYIKKPCDAGLCDTCDGVVCGSGLNESLETFVASQSQAFESVYSDKWPLPPVAGYGYFAFWPGEGGGICDGIDDCGTNRDRVRSQLSNLNTAIAYRQGQVTSDTNTDLVQIWNNGGSLALSLYTGSSSGITGTWMSPNMRAGINSLGWIGADFNGDRLMDVLQPWNNNGLLSVSVFNATQGGFSTLSGNDTSLPASYIALLPGDFTGEGRSDLVDVRLEYAGSYLVLQPIESDGTHFTLTSAHSFGTTVTNSSSWRVGRINDDSRDDVIRIYGDVNGHLQIRTYLSTGTGFSENLQSYGTTGSGALAWLVGHFNSDARTDVAQVWNNNGSPGIIPYFSDGRVLQQVQGRLFTTQSVSSNWLVGDVNGDGLDDIIQEHDAQGHVYIVTYLSDGAGFVQQPSTEFWSVSSSSIAWFPMWNPSTRRTNLLQLQNVSGRLGANLFASQGSTYVLQSQQ